jgi:hypothetical protein
MRSSRLWMRSFFFLVWWNTATRFVYFSFLLYITWLLIDICDEAAGRLLERTICVEPVVFMTLIANLLWMRSSRVFRAFGSKCQSRNCPEVDPSILRHSKI